MSKSSKTLSVIMAEYNTKPEHLKQAIQSILDQTYKTYEFIIVNDGSKNDLEKIAKSFDDPRIRIIDNNGNKGFIYSLNNAIRHANGDLLLRMDTDDISEADRLEKLLDFMDQNPEYDVVSCRAMEFSGDEKFGAIGKFGEKSKREIMRGDVPVHAASLMKKQAILDVGGYKEAYKRAEDLALWCEMALASKRLFMLDEIMYLYRVNKTDYSKRKLKYRGGEIKARLHYYPKMGAGPIEYLRVVKSIIAGVLPYGLIMSLRKKIILKEDK